jgi:hypothetical protein
MDKKKNGQRKPARNLTARKLTKKELAGVAAGGGRIVILGCCTQGCCGNEEIPNQS